MGGPMGSPAPGYARLSTTGRAQTRVQERFHMDPRGSHQQSFLRHVLQVQISYKKEPCSQSRALFVSRHPQPAPPAAAPRRPGCRSYLPPCRPSQSHDFPRSPSSSRKPPRRAFCTFPCSFPPTAAVPLFSLTVRRVARPGEKVCMLISDVS